MNAIEQAIEDQLRNKFGLKTLKILQHDYRILRQRTSIQEEPLNLKHKILPKKKEIPKSRLFVYGERECAVFLAGEFGFNLGILVRVLGELAGKGRKIGHCEENAVDESEQLLGSESIGGESIGGESIGGELIGGELIGSKLIGSEKSLQDEKSFEDEKSHFKMKSHLKMKSHFKMKIHFKMNSYFKMNSHLNQNNC